MPHATATISHRALKANVAWFQQQTNATIIAMIKGNAYGHGLMNVASAIGTEVDFLGVAHIQEGIALRQAHITTPILIFSGFMRPDQADLLKQYDLTPIIYQTKQYHWLTHPPSAGFWLKVNTGMNRLGLTSEAFEQLYQNIQQQQPMTDCHALTHLAQAEIPDDPFTQQQLQRFYHLTAGKNLKYISACNSAGVINRYHQHHDWLNTIRPGIGLYGANTLGAPLHPVMHLTSHIIDYYPIQTGQTVGYNRTFQATKPRMIALVAIGYGDGYPRNIQPNTPVLIDGHLCPIIGRVSMDMLQVDITDIAQHITIGTSVTLWGPKLPADTIAAAANTIPHDLLNGVNQRVDRHDQ